MKDAILSNLSDPAQLEHLYQGNKTEFKNQFMDLYPQLNGQVLADVWFERLQYQKRKNPILDRTEILLVILVSFLTGLAAKIPNIFTIDEDFFYQRNIGFLVFPGFIAILAWKNKLPIRHVLLLGASLIALIFYINILPDNRDSQTVILAYIHLPILLWMAYGFVFTKGELKNQSRWLSFLRYNGDSAILGALLGISGFLISGLTFGLFELIGVDIEFFYTQYVIVFGLAALPIVATFLTQANPTLTNKITPLIAKIFSPLVLIMLFSYLLAIIFTGKSQFEDREFLLMFNLLLTGVMGLIFFSVAESFSKEGPSVQTWILVLLSIVTIILNLIALTAISSRILEWGITPNRLAVLGSNVLMLLHLLLLAQKLYFSLKSKTSMDRVGLGVVQFLPYYLAWALVVIFLFPLIFGFG